MAAMDFTNHPMLAQMGSSQSFHGDLGGFLMAMLMDIDVSTDADGHS